MTDTGVTVVGFTELKRGTAQLFDHIERRADAELLTVARQRADMVRSIVPRVSGRLAGSVQADPYSGGSLVGMGDASTPYAGWVEFGGTRGRPYVPEGRYLTPIAVAAGHLVEHDMTTVANEEVRKFSWPQPPRTIA